MAVSEAFAHLLNSTNTLWVNSLVTLTVVFETAATSPVVSGPLTVATNKWLIGDLQITVKKARRWKSEASGFNPSACNIFFSSNISNKDLYLTQLSEVTLFCPKSFRKDLECKFIFIGKEINKLSITNLMINIT